MHYSFTEPLIMGISMGRGTSVVYVIFDTLESWNGIGSTDFKSYYPSLPIKRTAKIVAGMVIGSTDFKS